MQLVLTDTFYKKDQIKKINKKVVVLVGRSNVGKSSFINSIANRKALARTAKTAGKTLSLNCYLANDDFYVVDFPGYGYAKQSHETIERVEELCESFMRNQKINLALVLIDSRHPMQNNDKQIISYLESLKIQLILIATKCDKLKSNNELNKRRAQLRKEANDKYDLLFHSSSKNTGTKEIINKIKEYM